MRKLLLLFICLFVFQIVHAQVNARLMRYVDVSDDKICFVYGGDIWISDQTGGTAAQLTNSLGEESYPRFSPDGQSIAYSASYNGNVDVYIIPVSGGIPFRVTYPSHADRLVDWHPDGKHLLFSSRRESGRQSYGQFYKVSKEGGLPEKLDLPYGELASYSPDGGHLAYITKITENYPFKRYRGGLASDILIYDIKNKQVENITNNHGNDGKPTWVGNTVYFLSDQGKNMRLNIYAYDPSSKTTKQITKYSDFDITFLAGGQSQLVYQYGGDLYLMNTDDHKPRKISVNIIDDRMSEMPRNISVRNQIRNVTASPDGKRIVFEARGELFNVPAKEGYTINLTQSSGAFDRNPAWSPNGKYIAYWSDKSGENEIYLQKSDAKEKARKLTNRNSGYGYTLQWSPDSEQIAFIDEKNEISIIDVETGNLTIADESEWNIGHGGRNGFGIDWSSDSKWITYSKQIDNQNNAIFVYNLDEGKTHQLTSGFYSDEDPVFSDDDKYIFYLTDRNFSAAYSGMGDGTWVYPNATQIAAMSLTKDAPSLMKTKYDVYEVKEEEKEKKEKPEKKKEKEAEKENKDEGGEASQGEKEKEEKEEEKGIEIDFDRIESRIVILPPSAGNIRGIFPFKGKIVYYRSSNTGSSERGSKLVMYDLEKREEKDVFSRVGRAGLTPDGKSLLVSSGPNYGIIKPAPGQKIKDKIPTDGLTMNLVPKEEWTQIFNDTWRRHRDFFYDPAMHGLDWDALREQYGSLLKDARTRWDVSYIQSNLAAELSAGHTYTRGGDTERTQPRSTGYLGIDWEIAYGHYNIKRIIYPADWDTEVRSPFDEPGINVKEGDAIFSVNGIDLDISKDPYAAFEGLDGKTVVLEISSTGEREDAREVVVKCLRQFEETQLRYLEWIENNRKMVEELSDGKLGYIYMSNTSGRGQLELVKMFYGQLDKKGFIIDERFNGGGQLADRFLELLERPVVYNLHWRHGKDHTQPTKTNTGPMGMLINGWAGSGGDGLPWAFQELEAGPIVGERTLGILVGPATGHSLIDGGGITVPGARLYDNDGHWFWEGEGVKPDIPVWDDPNIMMQGRDPQVERVVKEVLKMLEANPPKMTPAPPPENRTAKGLNSKKN